MWKSYPQDNAQNLMCSFQLFLSLCISSVTRNSLHLQPYLILKPVVVSLTAGLQGAKPTFPCFYYKCCKKKMSCLFVICFNYRWVEVKDKGLQMFYYSMNMCWDRGCWIIFWFPSSLLSVVLFSTTSCWWFLQTERNEKFQMHYKMLFRGGSLGFSFVFS